MKKRAELNKIAEDLKKIEAMVKIPLRTATPNDPRGKELVVTRYTSNVVAAKGIARWLQEIQRDFTKLGKEIDRLENRDSTRRKGGEPLKKLLESSFPQLQKSIDALIDDVWELHFKYEHDRNETKALEQNPEAAVKNMLGIKPKS